MTPTHATRLLRTAADVTDRILELAEETYDGFFDYEGPIDWEDFLDRLCSYGQHEADPFDIAQMDNPAVRKIKTHIRKYRNL